MTALAEAAAPYGIESFDNVDAGEYADGEAEYWNASGDTDREDV